MFDDCVGLVCVCDKGAAAVTAATAATTAFTTMRYARGRGRSARCVYLENPRGSASWGYAGSPGEQQAWESLLGMHPERKDTLTYLC